MFGTQPSDRTCQEKLSRRKLRIGCLGSKVTSCKAGVKAVVLELGCYSGFAYILSPQLAPGRRGYRKTDEGLLQ